MAVLRMHNNFGEFLWEQLVYLLLHASVLEPDLHLRLVQAETLRDLDPSRPGQVLVRAELLL